ncbi:MAG TPA: 2Fe-2S iron-sulfur cluster-binding protein, partial [Lacipirellulaceae bacterium]|nr:2Fe-2S iron-sulfur cluster-binding protein [Lacipirellulaceae bacterium]
MTATVHINGVSSPAPAGASLFDMADQLGVTVPTSCRSQGKCKECLVEIVRGMELLSPPTPAEGHLRERFRLSCQCRVAAEEGVVECHTMRRGLMRIERHAPQLAPHWQQSARDPAVTRAGGRVLLDGQPIAEAGRGLYGLALDLGTTTIVLRLFDLESGEQLADASFENPQRFGGSDVMARIHYDETHRGRVLRRTLAGYLSRAIEELPVEPHEIYEMVVAGNS